MTWANVGVGRLYRPYVLRWFLLDPEGRVAATADGRADPREWLPGEHLVSEPLAVPTTLKAGDYALALSMVDPAGSRRPFQLAIDAPQAQGRYCLSRIRITGR